MAIARMLMHFSGKPLWGADLSRDAVARFEKAGATFARVALDQGLNRDDLSGYFD